jgi:DNA-binding HxlR family transcriptional regulator
LDKEDSFDSATSSDKEVIQQGYALDVFDVFGDYPYTIPLTILIKSWMSAIPENERHRTHLWTYVRTSYRQMDNGISINDHSYRQVLQRLRKRGVVKPIQLHRGRRPKYDYELTVYGEAVCKKLEESVKKQIRLERWRRRQRLGSQN